MKNWSTDEIQMRKNDPEAYEIWRLEQLINYGLDGEMLPEGTLKKYWDKLSLDDAARRYLSFLLWPEKKTS